MTDSKGQSPKASKPKARKVAVKVAVAKSQPSRASKPRSAPASAAKSAPAKPATKFVAKSAALAEKPTLTEPARKQAAAPLLARADKKTSTSGKSAPPPIHAAKPAPKASYQPKTEPPRTPVVTTPHSDAPRPPAMFDVLAFARPWMNLGWRMTATSLSMQARLARAALEMPPAATAMRQGTKAMNAWLGLVQGRAPKSDEK